MYIVLLMAAVMILGGVIAVAMGRGGEITAFRRDLPVAPLQARTPADVAMLRLPLGLFGCQEQATGDALRAAARLLAERDAEIARLRDEIWRLGLKNGDSPPASDAGTASSGDALSSTPRGHAGGQRPPQT